MRTHWHIFRTAPHREAEVHKALGWRAIEALAPRTKRFERISRRRSIETDAPLFAGYVFACVYGPLWLRTRNLPGLHPQPIAMGGTPYRLLEADVAAIRLLQDNPLTDPRAPVAPHVFKSGELVRILQGPFATYRATVEADAGETVRTKVQIFGRPTPYEVPRGWVEAA